MPLQHERGAILARAQIIVPRFPYGKNPSTDDLEAARHRALSDKSAVKSLSAKMKASLRRGTDDNLRRALNAVYFTQLERAQREALEIIKSRLLDMPSALMAALEMGHDPASSELNADDHRNVVDALHLVKHEIGDVKRRRHAFA